MKKQYFRTAALLLIAQEVIDIFFSASGFTEQQGPILYWVLVVTAMLCVVVGAMYLVAGFREAKKF